MLEFVLAVCLCVSTYAYEYIELKKINATLTTHKLATKCCSSMQFFGPCQSEAQGKDEQVGESEIFGLPLGPSAGCRSLVRKFDVPKVRTVERESKTDMEAVLALAFYFRKGT